ncbi:MAG: alanine racemase [Oscillospiraceae bacterium]|jgi:alanine racemase|nr:alanine racemase [Oscillospiraceae bacterium]
MIDYLRRSWAVVNLNNVAHNFTALKRVLTPGCKVMAAVKADAYGHGDKYIADQLVRLGVDWFGVSNLEEALSLREQGIYHPILIFGVTPPENVRQLNEYNLTQSIYSLPYARELHAAAQAAGVGIQVHIKIDMGMSRLGFVLDNGFAEISAGEIKEVCRMPRFQAQGIFTHFACADERNDDSMAYTRGQYRKFCALIARLEQEGVTFSIRHCCNSAGAIGYPDMHMDMVRPGIVLYGLSPSDDCAGMIDLKPAMELYSCVSMVKEIADGTPVSYGRCYTAHRKTKVATVAIGYADGYERELTNKARMLVRGQYANVIGRVCMDQLMLDVTHIDGVAAGDVVTIVGEDGGRRLTFDEMAALSGSINYEKVCLIGKRVPRIYRQDGKDIGVVDYIRHYGVKGKQSANGLYSQTV